MPHKVGTQDERRVTLDSGLRRNDGKDR